MLVAILRDLSGRTNMRSARMSLFHPCQSRLCSGETRTLFSPGEGDEIVKAVSSMRHRQPLIST